MDYKNTRALVEHYLRATGWTQKTENDHLYWCRDGYSLPALGDADALTALVERRVDRDIKFHLGMCAAAEHDLIEARRLVDTPACFALQRVGEEKLRLAGITPDAWEKARVR